MSLHHSPTIITSGLVCYLDARNSKSYPGSGTTWTNMLDATNNGTISGATYNSDGYFTFNGTSNYVSMPDTTGVTDFNRTDNYSIFFMCNIHQTQLDLGNADNNIIEKWGTPSGPYPYVFRWYRAFNFINIAVYDGTAAVSGAIDVPPGNWIYCGATFDWTGQAKCNMYLNGNNTGSFNLTLTNTISNTSTLGIMRRENGTNYTRGSLAAFKIYNRSLSADEIKQNFNALRGRFGI